MIHQVESKNGHNQCLLAVFAPKTSYTPRWNLWNAIWVYLLGRQHNYSLKCVRKHHRLCSFAHLHHKTYYSAFRDKISYWVLEISVFARAAVPWFAELSLEMYYPMYFRANFLSSQTKSSEFIQNLLYSNVFTRAAVQFLAKLTLKTRWLMVSRGLRGQNPLYYTPSLPPTLIRTFSST